MISKEMKRCGRRQRMQSFDDNNNYIKKVYANRILEDSTNRLSDDFEISYVNRACEKSNL